MKKVMVLVVMAVMVMASADVQASAWFSATQLLESCSADRSDEAYWLRLGACAGMIGASLEAVSEFVACNEKDNWFRDSEGKGCDGTRYAVDLPEGLTIEDVIPLIQGFAVTDPSEIPVSSAPFFVFKATLKAFGFKELPARKQI